MLTKRDSQPLKPFNRFNPSKITQISCIICWTSTVTLFFVLSNNSPMTDGGGGVCKAASGFCTSDYLSLSVFWGQKSGARFCALVGDFYGWSPAENCAKEGHFGHDDNGYWFIIIEDKLREGEEPDNLYFQQYNYVNDYDKGDSGITVEEAFKKSNDGYWKPGEDRIIKSRYEKVVFKLEFYDEKIK